MDPKLFFWTCIRIRLFRKFWIRIRFWVRTYLLISKEAKPKFLIKTAKLILILKKRFLKSTFEFFCPYSKIFSNQWGLSRFHTILDPQSWSSLDPNPKLIITDPEILLIILDPTGTGSNIGF